MKFLRDEKQFVSSFLESPREHCYGRLLFPSNTLNTKQLADASVSHTVKGFVAEVKQYICTNVSSEYSNSVESFDDPCHR